MPITVRLCEEKDDWDSYLSGCESGTLFHKWDMLKIMEKHSVLHILGRNYPSKFLPLVGYNNETIFGLYPIFYYNAPFLSWAFSPPLGSGTIYQGPIHNYCGLKQSTKEDFCNEFQNKVDEYLKELGVSMVKIRTPPGMIDARSFTHNKYLVEPFYTYEIDISRPIEEVWDSFQGSVRKNVKKTSSHGVIVREGSREEVQSLHSALEGRMTAQGLGNEIDYDYLIDVYDLLYPDNIRLMVTDMDGRYLTSLMLLLYGRKAIAWIGIARAEISGIYPNDLLLWESIKWAKEKGCETFEIMWANTGRLNKYKSKFNPEAVVYFSCSRMPRIMNVYNYLKHNNMRNPDT